MRLPSVQGLQLKEDEGYGKTVRNAIKEFMPTQKTVMGLIEAIDDFIHLTDDPDTILNLFKQKGQHLSEPLQSYVGRKQTGARTVMLDEHHNVKQMIQIVISRSV